MAGRFQFSIRAALVATALISIAATACAAEPSWKSLIALETLAVLLAVASIIAARLTTHETNFLDRGSRYAVAVALSGGHRADVVRTLLPGRQP
jgi:hypothetical protein